VVESNYGTLDCTCHEAYKGRGMHEPNAQGCGAVVADWIGMVDRG
jgi:hypothetical protein